MDHNDTIIMVTALCFGIPGLTVIAGMLIDYHHKRWMIENKPTEKSKDR